MKRNNEFGVTDRTGSAHCGHVTRARLGNGGTRVCGEVKELVIMRFYSDLHHTP